MVFNSAHSGQMCVAGTRVYIQEGIYDTIVPILVGALGAFTLGDGFDPKAVAGPLVSQAQLDVRFPSSRSPICPD